jgi:hypothetical protein
VNRGIGSRSFPVGGEPVNIVSRGFSTNVALGINTLVRAVTVSKGCGGGSGSGSGSGS